MFSRAGAEISAQRPARGVCHSDGVEGASRGWRHVEGAGTPRRTEIYDAQAPAPVHQQVARVRVAVVEPQIEQLPAEQLDAQRHEFFYRRL